MKLKSNCIIEKYIKARTEDTYLQAIPKKIFQTWKTTELSQQMYDSVMTIINNNPEYEYFFSIMKIVDLFLENITTQMCLLHMIIYYQVLIKQICGDIVYYINMVASILIVKHMNFHSDVPSTGNYLFIMS